MVTDITPRLTGRTDLFYPAIVATSSPCVGTSRGCRVSNSVVLSAVIREQLIVNPSPGGNDDNATTRGKFERLGCIG